MNIHFKEMDVDNNQEISYENLKKCLYKENEVFSRKDIEIILKQINPNKNFEYWKFDSILAILYKENFDFTKLMKEDKIYNYLIKIFKKQDVNKCGKLNYKKMKYAFLIEDKLKLNKIQILTILNFFDLEKNPELDYYKSSLVIRNVIENLFLEINVMQRFDINSPQYQIYQPYNDIFDDHLKNIKLIFTEFDKDYDNLLSREEFENFIEYLITGLELSLKQQLFEKADEDRDGKLSYFEFKNNFKLFVDLIRYYKIRLELDKIV